MIRPNQPLPKSSAGDRAKSRTSDDRLAPGSGDTGGPDLAGPTSYPSRARGAEFALDTRLAAKSPLPMLWSPFGPLPLPRR